MKYYENVKDSLSIDERMEILKKIFGTYKPKGIDVKEVEKEIRDRKSVV